MNINAGIAVENIEVTVDIDHGRIGDLIITLTSPDGTDSLLLNRPGKSPGSDNSDLGLLDTTLRFALPSTHFLG